MMNKKCNLMQFILQIQAQSNVQASSLSADEVSFTEATKGVKVCEKDTWSFSGVVNRPEILCAVH